MGINDIAKGASLRAILINFNKIVYAVKVKCPLARIYIMSVLPVDETKGTEVIPLIVNNSKINQLNTTTERFCKKHGVTFIEVNSLLKGNDRQLLAECFIDGVHINALGYEKIKNKIVQYVNE